MELDLSKTILVTHKGCQDGSACAILFLAAGGKKENIYFTNPSHEETDFLLSELIQYRDTDIMLVDVSCSTEMAKYIEKSIFANNVTILDHHKSAASLNNFPFCVVDESGLNCGSKIFYDWILKYVSNLTKLLRYKELVKLTNDVDLWQHNYPESRELADFHKILGQELFIERFVKNPNSDLSCQESYLTTIYNKKREIETANRKKNIKKFVKTINGVNYNFAILFTHGADQSLLGHAITDDPSMDVDVVILINGNNVSLRCKDSCVLDLSELAQRFGGGGHKKASSFSLGKLFIFNKDFLEIIVDNFIEKT